MDKSSGKPSSSRPWSSEPRSLEAPHFTQSLGMSLAVRERCMYFRCTVPRSLPALARGVAKYLPVPASIWVVRSDRVSAKEAADVTQRLLSGQSVLLAHHGASDLLVELANQWSECTSFPDGSTFVYASFVLKGVENAGFLAIVHALDEEGPLPRKATVCRVPAAEVATLEVLGNASLVPIADIG